MTSSVKITLQGHIAAVVYHVHFLWDGHCEQSWTENKTFSHCLPSHFSSVQSGGAEETRTTCFPGDTYHLGICRGSFLSLAPSTLGKSVIVDPCSEVVLASQHSSPVQLTALLLPYPSSVSLYGSNYIIPCQILPPLSRDSNNDNYQLLNSY